MFIPDPGFCPSHPATKEMGEKKFDGLPFSVATNITKLKIILILTWRRKILASLQRILELSTQTIVIKL
jgi:hypothetical protein